MFTAAQLGRLCLNAYVLKWGASCQPGGVYKTWGILPFRSCPAHCLTWTVRYFLLLHHPFIHLSVSAFTKKAAESSSPVPPLLSTYVRSLLLYLRSASINHYLPSLILFIEESPPTFPPAERTHCHQSASRLLSREIGICSLLHFSLRCLLHPLSLHLWHRLCSLLLCFCLTGRPPLLFNSIYFPPQTFSKRFIFCPTNFRLNCQ